MLERMQAAITVGDEGTFRAIASHSASIANGERGPTRFASGAFREALARSTRYPLLWQHKDDQPVGVVELSEGTEGLTADGRIALSVQQGKEAHDLLKLGAIDGVSIGFTAEKARHETQGGKSVRVIEQARLMEVSLVTFPADPNARVQTVHSEWNEDAEVTALSGAVERFEGRVFSESNLTKIRAALGTLVDLVEAVDPGHIASLGRRAARTLRKSFLYADKEQKKRAKASHASALLRRLEGLTAGVDIPVPSFVGSNENAQALVATLDAVMELPADAQQPLVVSAVKQYLVAIGEAEEADEEEDAAEDDRETHIHNPHVKEVDGKYAVVDDDGKVYGTHDTKDEADAQVRALNAAKG